MEIPTWAEYLLAGAVLSLALQRGTTFAWSRVKDWETWLAGDARLNFLLGVERLGYRLDHREEQEFVDGPSGMKPTMIVRWLYGRWHRSSLRAALADFEEVGGPATILP
jgi:hypothetical protein